MNLLFISTWSTFRLCPSIPLGVLWFEFPHHPEAVERRFSKDVSHLLSNFATRYSTDSFNDLWFNTVLYSGGR